MKNDIQNREDIALVIQKFYSKLLRDDQLKHFFERIVHQKQIDKHLETITDFWYGILFNDLAYKGNAMQAHILLNRTIPFKKEHFKVWLHHFSISIDEHFSGQKAEMAKIRALSIATIMEIKMIDSEKK